MERELYYNRNYPYRGQLTQLARNDLRLGIRTRVEVRLANAAGCGRNRSAVSLETTSHGGIHPSSHTVIFRCDSTLTQAEFSRSCLMNGRLTGLLRRSMKRIGSAGPTGIRLTSLPLLPTTSSYALHRSRPLRHTSPPIQSSRIFEPECGVGPRSLGTRRTRCRRANIGQSRVRSLLSMKGPGLPLAFCRPRREHGTKRRGVASTTRRLGTFE